VSSQSQTSLNNSANPEPHSETLDFIERPSRLSDEKNNQALSEIGNEKHAGVFIYLCHDNYPLCSDL
jgi:hypothetical protein